MIFKRKTGDHRKEAERLGKQGEDRIDAILATIPDSRVFRNVYIPCGHNRTIEIDAILLTQKGLFIIEAKNYGGQITGSFRLNEWTQTYKKKGSHSPIRHKFYNPVKQNAAHVQAISRYLKLPLSKQPHSMVVFTSRAELKKVPPNAKEYSILTESILRSTIIRRLKARKEIFDAKEMSDIVQRLNQLPRATKKLKQVHIRQAKMAEAHRIQEREKRRKRR
ncbi:MAG: nuclease-related domain-containing protein [Eggerthellales bacterium]|nr:nuclease-related domain-containing protein [Eggerthellales bacterium]